ncbi:hypothetical protein [Thalassotalea euphylliae]|nr:hypothetical protein [Thalassotalea euphylliae]
MNLAKKLVVVLLFVSFQAGAYLKEEYYWMGKKAYKAKDYVTSLKYTFAFYELNRESIEDRSDFGSALLAIIKDCEFKLNGKSSGGTFHENVLEEQNYRMAKSLQFKSGPRVIGDDGMSSLRMIASTYNSTKEQRDAYTYNLELKELSRDVKPVNLDIPLNMQQTMNSSLEADAIYFTKEEILGGQQYRMPKCKLENIYISCGY